MSTTILWHLAEPFSTERCTLSEARLHHLLTGTVLHHTEGHLYETRYAISLDPQWHTRRVFIRTTGDGQERTLTLLSDGNGQWTLNNQARSDLDGCTDIDLGVTPATNTLPIRRLALSVGQSAEVDAAWVRFPRLSVERLHQRYTRLAPDQYRYESPNFTALLQVDAQGLVRDYEGLWHAVAVTG
jgi:hypothetical protein